MLLWLVLASIASIALPAAAQAVRGYSVEIVGAGDLSELIEEHLEIMRHRDEPALSQEEFMRLVEITPQQIRDLLATEGYFSPVVEHEVLQRGGRPLVRFRVEPGEPTRVGSVDIRFSGDIVQSGQQQQRMERLRRQWAFKTGERFRQQEWSNAKNALLKNLLVRDYAAADIADSEARVDPGKRVADLFVEVDSGPAFTFDGLQVEGLQRYSRRLIDQLNPIQPGEPYSQERLNELQGRVQDTGYFRSVFASIEVNPARPKNVPVRLDVVENPRKRLAFGIGFSTDAGLRGEVKWLDRNFLQRDWRLESNLLIDSKTKRVGAGVFLPALRNGWIPSVNTRYERTDVTGELTDTVRLGANVTSPVKADEQSWGVAYFADRQRVGDIFTNNRQALIASYSYTRRRLDNIISPRQGYVASVNLGAGPRGLINAANIGRVVAGGTWLHMLDRRWQAVLRGQIGQVFGASRFDVPSDLLFRTGGDQTVRGYAFDTLGVPEGTAIVGGRVLAVVSAEMVYYITPAWGAAVFTDAGNAADSWSEFSFALGTGVGARWRSPIGPVNIDLAYGHETHKPRLHFSVGYAF
jgi:translocation and assembly module TamA